MPTRKRGRKRNQDRIYRLGITVTEYRHRKANGAVREGYIVRVSDMKSTERTYFPKAAREDAMEFVRKTCRSLARTV